MKSKEQDIKSNVIGTFILNIVFIMIQRIMMIILEYLSAEYIKHTKDTQEN